MIPFEQLSESLARWKNDRRAPQSPGNGASSDEAVDLREAEAEVEPEEVLEPEPE